MVNTKAGRPFPTMSIIYFLLGSQFPMFTKYVADVDIPSPSQRRSLNAAIMVAIEESGVTLTDDELTAATHLDGMELVHWINSKVREIGKMLEIPPLPHLD